MRYVVVLLLLAALGFVVYRVVMYYDTTKGTVWERILATARHSHAILWNFFVIIGGSIYGLIGPMADLLGMPEVKAFIDAHVSPEYAGMIAVAIAGVGIWARLYRATDLPPDKAT